MFLTTRYDSETMHELWTMEGMIIKVVPKKGEIEWCLRGTSPNAVVHPSKEWLKGFVRAVLDDAEYDGMERVKEGLVVRAQREGAMDVRFKIESMETFKEELRRVCMGGWERPEK